MVNSIIDKAIAYDKQGLNKKQVDNAIICLKEFRTKFPFIENPASIATLKPDDVFKETSDEVGEFFHYLEYYFKPLGSLQFDTPAFTAILGCKLKISKTCFT
jgi:hypothetical protein